ncbi:MAG TPA: ABC-F family ATP-binding cassette domain-containing protein [Stellaceae bacterium]|nr:ABC-F family ATP-binding cassette domain-containing protein [Stellaceae bacterium]
MLSIAALTYRVAGLTLLEEASAQVPAGHRVGLVGRNGAGKSTLLDLIRGALQPDGGAIDLPRGTRIGMVAQEAPGGSTTPLDTVLAADEERASLLKAAETETDGHALGEIHGRLAEIDAHSAPARAARILAGLGFDEAMQARPMSSFSGGWRMRVALAAVLFVEPDLLLLDEPTNHLDLEATLWLQSYLEAYPRTLILVSHDRHILNAVPDHILHLDQRKLAYYPGGYDEFERLRAAKIEQSQALAAKQATRRAHLQSFVDRFRYKATKARQAQSRLKAIAKLAPVAVLQDDPSVTFAFPEPAELAPPLISLEGVSVGYEPGRPILSRLDLRIDPEDRIALLGANGNGKSTFAKLLAGRLPPMSGRQHRAAKLECGFFAQHQIEEMDPEGSAFDHLARLMPRSREFEIRTRLGRFGFSGDKAFVAVRSLSGGERARLNFALITSGAPPLLILDEPTNHLDLDTRETLAEAINDFPGAVILITHDWHLLELTADRLWLVAEGRVRPFDGDLEDYRKLMLGQRSAGEPPTSRWAERPRGAERRKQLEPLRRRAREAEQAMEALVAQRDAVERALMPAELETAARVELMRRRASLEREVVAAEQAWLDAAQALETAAAE